MDTEPEPSEADKERAVPGIVYVEGGAGRRAHVVGGLDVWEIIRAIKALGRAETERRYDGMTPAQFDAAERFYTLFPAEINARLAAETAFDITVVWAEHPQTRPPWRRASTR